MKRILSFAIVMAILVASVLTVPVAYAEENNGTSSVSVWDGTIPTANSSYTYGGGTGTAQDPYLLKTAYDVAMLAANVNNGENYSWDKTFKLCVDLDMNNQAWPGIGNAQTRDNPVRTFKGAFDGDGHVVYNLNLSSEPVTESSTGTIGRGFFGATFDATIKNFGIASGTIELTNNRSVGAIVGCAWRTLTMENCFSGADMVLSYEIDKPASSDTNVVFEDEDAWYAGGLIGSANQNTNGTALTNCFWFGSIEAKVSKDMPIAIGGIVGMVLNNNLTLNSVTSVGSITIDSVGTQAHRVSSLLGWARTPWSVAAGGENSYNSIAFVNCKAGGNVSFVGSNVNTARVSALSGWNWHLKWTVENTVYNYNCGNDAVTQIVGNFGSVSATSTTDEIKITSSALFTNYAYQNGKAATEGEYKIRFASELAVSPYAFAKAGYIVTVSYNDNGTTKTADIELSGKVVYTSLRTPSGDVTPKTGKCFVAQGITDIPLESATFTMTPFVETADGVRIYGTTTEPTELPLVPEVVA